MVGITSEEEDASELFSGIKMPKMDRYLCDGASWLIVVEEGESVDTTGSGATTLAMTSGAGCFKPQLDHLEKLDNEIWSFPCKLRVIIDNDEDVLLSINT
ncbi:hypothetical protein Tco_0880256 [Tanacetum coccineum]